MFRMYAVFVCAVALVFATGPARAHKHPHSPSTIKASGNGPTKSQTKGTKDTTGGHAHKVKGGSSSHGSGMGTVGQLPTAGSGSTHNHKDKTRTTSTDPTSTATGKQPHVRTHKDKTATDTGLTTIGGEGGPVSKNTKLSKSSKGGKNVGKLDKLLQNVNKANYAADANTPQGQDRITAANNKFNHTKDAFNNKQTDDSKKVGTKWYSGNSNVHPLNVLVDSGGNQISKPGDNKGVNNATKRLNKIAQKHPDGDPARANASGMAHLAEDRNNFENSGNPKVTGWSPKGQDQIAPTYEGGQ